MLQYFCLCEVIRQYVCGKKEIPVLRTYHLKTIFLWMAEEVIMLTLVGNSNKMNIHFCTNLSHMNWRILIKDGNKPAVCLFFVFFQKNLDLLVLMSKKEIITNTKFALSFFQISNIFLIYLLYASKLWHNSLFIFTWMMFTIGDSAWFLHNKREQNSEISVHVYVT